MSTLRSTRTFTLSKKLIDALQMSNAHYQLSCHFGERGGRQTNGVTTRHYIQTQKKHQINGQCPFFARESRVTSTPDTDRIFVTDGDGIYISKTDTVRKSDLQKKEREKERMIVYIRWTLGHCTLIPRRSEISK